MYLSEFIKESGITKIHIATKSGINYATLINLISGRDVRGSVLVKIERFTNGQVTCEDLYSEFVERKTKKSLKPKR